MCNDQMKSGVNKHCWQSHSHAKAQGLKHMENWQNLPYVVQALNWQSLPLVLVQILTVQAREFRND